MTVVRYGDRIQLHYTTYGADGCVLETSGRCGPLEFRVGDPGIIAGITRAVVGMRQGERRRIAVAPEQAFGLREGRLQVTAPRLELLEQADEGDQLSVQVHETGLAICVRTMTDDEVVLDANHPLAGESLVYEIEVVSVAPEAAAC